MASFSKLFQPLLPELPLRFPASELLLPGVVDPHSLFDILVLDVEEEDEDEEDDDALLPQGRGIPAGGPIVVWVSFSGAWPAEYAIGFELKPQDTLF